MSGTSPASTPTVKGVRPLSVQLKDHCILCLQPEDHEVVQNILTTNPKSLFNFQPLVYYLTAIDPTNTTQMAQFIKEHKYFPVINNLPPMCATCYDVLGEMYRLHTHLFDIKVKLQKQIALARRIVKFTNKEKSAYRQVDTARAGFFKKMGLGLRRLLNAQEMQELRYFVENFHGLIIEAENKYIFPCPPPPPDPTSKELPRPERVSLTAALVTLSYPVKFAQHSISSPSEAPTTHSSYTSRQEYNYQSSPSSQSQHSTSSRPASTGPLSQSVSTPSPSSHSSYDTNNSTTNEVIVVSGMDTNVKFEVEGDDDNGGDMEGDDLFEEEPVKVVRVPKREFVHDDDDDNLSDDTYGDMDNQKFEVDNYEYSGYLEEEKVSPSENVSSDPVPGSSASAPQETPLASPTTSNRNSYSRPTNKCPSCCYCFVHLDGYIAHLKTIHPRIPKRCHLCVSSFGNLSLLRSHYENDHGVNFNVNKSTNADLTCDVCGKICVGSTALLKHVKLKHKRQPMAVDSSKRAKM